ncbi:MAG: choice-of-anchor Q domain-containing protein [Actinomycetota bacterium]
MHPRRLVLILGASLAAAALPAAPAAAAVISPTVFSDDLTDNGNCTLREAIHAANNDVPKDACPQGSGPDTIQLTAGTYSVSVPSTDEDAGANGDLDVNQDLSILGTGVGTTTIDGAWTSGPDRILEVHGVGTELVIQTLTIQDGNEIDADGGGVRVAQDASLTATDVDLVKNLASDIGGIENHGAAVLNRVRFIENGVNDPVGCCGAMFNEGGSVTMTDVVFAGNTAAIDSGAFLNQSAGATLTNVTFSNNRAGRQGGAVSLTGTEMVTLTNVTMSGNSSDTHGGAIAYSGSGATLNNVTLTGNTADADNAGDPGDGGGIYRGSGSLTIRNSIIAGNADLSGQAPDCGQDSGDAFTSGGHNLIGNTTGCTFTPGSGDLLNVDPHLGPLSDNGGFTQTHALLPSSPAIDAAGPDAAPTDQRGAPRPDPDIGAYELHLCLGLVVNRVGGTDADVLTGTEGSDAFLPQGGDDTATGLGGDDAFCLGDGNDTADGGSGKDGISGEDGNDTTKGGGGNDTQIGGPGNDKLSGGGGKDNLKGQAGKDKLKGQGGKDRLRGGGGKDKCNGGGGKDKAACEKERKVP